MKPRTIALLELLLIALLIALFLWWIHPTEVAIDNTTDLPTTPTTTIPVFAAPEIEATAALVYDMKEGKALFKKNAGLQLPLASLTKVMTALTASERIPEYVLVRITRDDLLVEGDSGLFPGEEWNVDDLIDYSLVVSSNDGASALASVGGALLSTTTPNPVDQFVREMNSTAKRIGMKNTYFLNPSGLDVSPSLSGGYGSAEDMAILFEHIINTNPKLLEATSFESLQVASKLAVHNANNTNKAINAIPGVIGSKTGFTDLSGGNLVVAFNAGVDRPIIVAVLNSSMDGRFSDMSALVSATLEYLTNF